MITCSGAPFWGTFFFIRDSGFGIRLSNRALTRRFGAVRFVPGSSANPGTRCKVLKPKPQQGIFFDSSWAYLFTFHRKYTSILGKIHHQFLNSRQNREYKS